MYFYCLMAEASVSDSPNILIQWLVNDSLFAV